MARRRELEAMPLRSLNSIVGSTEMVSTGPAPCLDTNVWSSQPPARSRR